MMRERSCPATPLTSTPSAASSPSLRRGLYAYVGHRVVELLTEPQLVDHAVSVLPQLHSVTTRPHFHGPHWTTLRKKHGVDMYEFDPSTGGNISTRRCSRAAPSPPPPASSVSSTHSTTPTDSWLDGRPMSSSPASRATLPHGFQTQYKLPNPGIDMSYAVVAQCELDGHVDDVMDVLFNDEPIDFEASMKTLWHNKLKRGDLLLSRHVQGRSLTLLDNDASDNTSLHDVSRAAHIDDLAVPLPGTLAIKTATVGAGLSFKRRHHGNEKLCYTSFTQRSSPPSSSPQHHDTKKKKKKIRGAFHVIKTLPLHIHDQIACGKTHMALRDPRVDHIAVGYHLTSMDSVMGGPRTRLVVCAYASAIPALSTESAAVSRASQLHWHPRMDGNVPSRMSLHGGRSSSSSSSAYGSGGSSTSVNSDVRRVVMMLAKAARDFQQAVRQRRFGVQRFVYFPTTTTTTTDRNSCRGSIEQCCVVCLRRFGLFRKDHYCQLCGHLVCRQCSRKHKVEPVAGKVRENRICFPCVARVDTSAFHEEQLWKSMDRPVVVDADVISPLGYDGVCDVILEGDDDDHDQEHVPAAVPVQIEDEDENDLGFNLSYGSADSASSAPSFLPSATSTGTMQRPEIQVAHDLFSPHPTRRASALELLSRAVLDARNSQSTSSGKSYYQSPVELQPQQMPKTPRRRLMDPTLVDMYLAEKQRLKMKQLELERLETPVAPRRSSLTTRYDEPQRKTKPRTSCISPTTSESDRMHLYSVCYPRANPTAVTTAPLVESTTAKPLVVGAHCSRLSRSSLSTVAIDTGAFDSICEALVERQKFALAFLTVHKRDGTRQIVGLHQASTLRYRFPRHVDLASYCPSFAASSVDHTTSTIVCEPMLDVRFRHFPLVDDARMRFFAQFAIAGISSRASSSCARGDIVGASLCVMDTAARDPILSKHEWVTIETLCAVASDLLRAARP